MKLTILWCLNNSWNGPWLNRPLQNGTYDYLIISPDHTHLQNWLIFMVSVIKYTHMTHMDNLGNFFFPFY